MIKAPPPHKDQIAYTGERFMMDQHLVQCLAEEALKLNWG